MWSSYLGASVCNRFKTLHCLRMFNDSAGEYYHCKLNINIVYVKYPLTTVFVQTELHYFAIYLALGLEQSTGEWSNQLEQSTGE